MSPKIWLFSVVAVAVPLAAYSWWQSRDTVEIKAEPVAGIAIPIFSQRARDGNIVFDANCQTCHGPSAIGTDQGPPLVHIVYEPNHHADYSFVQAVRRGVKQHHWTYGAMPSIPGLSDKDIENVIAYVRELQRANGIQ